MTAKHPFVTTIKASDVRRLWSPLINRVFRDETRVLIERSGLPVAAIISAADLKRFLKLESESDAFYAMMDGRPLDGEEEPLE